MIHLLLALSAPAAAQQLATLTDGAPEFESCLEDTDDCEDRFFRFLTHSMVEQGFTFQEVPLLTSPLTNRRAGWVVGGKLDTFPLTPPRKNLSGKVEETDYSPVLPRIVGGWLGSAGDTELGAGAFFLPPVPVKGASALVGGADAGAAWALGERARLGAELDFTFTRARAPIVASEEQFENREEGGYESNLQVETYEANCGGEGGCIDTFTVANTGLRLGGSWELGDFTPHVRLGVAYLWEQLYVQYDDTTWLVRGLQYSAHLGGNLAVAEGLRLGLSSSLAWRPERITQDEGDDTTGGLFFKLVGSAGWQF